MWFQTIFVAMFWIVGAGDTGWKLDPAWHDGLVEKATYSATRVVYGKPRTYTAIFFTNKEQHDRATLTKAYRAKDTIEVFKFNIVETIPTPNYPYHYVTTAHLSVVNLELTRLDCSSQEFCGTSFKQYLKRPGERSIDYWSFSYMPESGRSAQRFTVSPAVVAHDSLPLFLRNFDFAGRTEMRISLLPPQRSNRATDYRPVDAIVRYVREDDDAHVLEVWSSGQLAGTYSMAKDRMHVMLRFESGDRAQRYELQSLERTDYWTIRGE